MKKNCNNQSLFSNNFLKKNCKGSNVSFSIAFVVFISFVVFLVGIIDPMGKIEGDKDFIMDHLQNEIIENVSGELNITSSVSGNNLIKIYEFDGMNPSDCTEMASCEQGLKRSEKYIFKSKVLELNESYSTDYEGMKNYFGIPDVNDFKFSFLYLNRTEMIIADKPVPTTDIFVKSIPVIYVDSAGERNGGYLKLTVW